jgi:uncharacterized protein (TIGR01244 family)
MVQLITIDEKTAVAGQLMPADLQQVAAHGFKLVVNNRPEGESFGQPSASELSTEAEKHGMTFASIPFRMPGTMTSDQVAEFAKLLAAADGKVIAYCRSGMRSVALWAAASVALGQPIQDVLGKAAKAGFDMRQAAGFLEDLGQAAARAS